MAICNLLLLLIHWSYFREPPVAVAAFAAAVGLVAALWRLGPVGIGPVTSAVACLTFLALLIIVGLQLTAEGQTTGFVMNTWGAAVTGVLGFSRPVEEPLATMCCAIGIDTWLLAGADLDVQTRHQVFIDLGAPFVLTCSALAVIAALRSTVAATRLAQQRAETLDQRRAVVDAVHRGRLARFALWEREVEPLLQQLADGTRDPADPEVAADSQRLSGQMRTQLSVVGDSVLETLLSADVTAARAGGVSIEIHDLDIGFRLRELDRLTLVELTRQLCVRLESGSLQLTALAVDELDSAPAALVIIAVDGTPCPDTPLWKAEVAHSASTITYETPTRWWWDRQLACDPAPTLTALDRYLRGDQSGSAPVEER